MYGRYYGNSELARDSEDANAERVYRVADAMAFAYGLERKARECNTTPDCPLGRIDCEHCLGLRDDDARHALVEK